MPTLLEKGKIIKQKWHTQKDNDFIIDKVYANDPEQNEVNIFFSNKRKDYTLEFQQHEIKD